MYLSFLLSFLGNYEEERELMFKIATNPNLKFNNLKNVDGPSFKSNKAIEQPINNENQPKISGDVLASALMASKLSFKGANETINVAEVIDLFNNPETNFQECSVKVNPEGGGTFSTKVNDKTYNFISSYEDHKLVYSLEVKQDNSEEAQKINLSEEDGNKLNAIIEEKIYPIIEKQYGFGKGLDTSNILIDLAEKSLKNELVWEEGPTDIDFISISQSITTELPDKTKIYLAEKIGIFSDNSTYLGIQKPGLPLQFLAISGDNEKEQEAATLLGYVFKVEYKEKELDEQEKVIAQTREQCKEAREQIKQYIDEFKAKQA